MFSFKVRELTLEQLAPLAETWLQFPPMLSSLQLPVIPIPQNSTAHSYLHGHWHTYMWYICIQDENDIQI